MKIATLLLALTATGCFDSLVDSPCAVGELVSHGVCVVATAGTPDGGPITTATPDGPSTISPDGPSSITPDGPSTITPDAPPTITPDAPPAVTPDAFVCTAEIETDPMNCGACGVQCVSGLCSAGKCLGTTPGHIVGIGHDFRHTNAVMSQVLANALALGDATDLAVAHWTGTATSASSTAIARAVDDSLRTTGQVWHSAALPADPAAADAFAGIDVIVIDPQGGDGATAEASGAAWQSTFGTFVANGGVVVVLEAPATVSYRFAAGAHLYSLTAPSEVSNQAGYVVDGTDAIARAVLSPYRAESDSVAFPVGSVPAVVATGDGSPIVFHLAY